MTPSRYTDEQVTRAGYQFAPNIVVRLRNSKYHAQKLMHISTSGLNGQTQMYIEGIQQYFRDNNIDPKGLFGRRKRRTSNVIADTIGTRISMEAFEQLHQQRAEPKPKDTLDKAIEKVLSATA